MIFVLFVGLGLLYFVAYGAAVRCFASVTPSDPMCRFTQPTWVTALFWPAVKTACYSRQDCHSYVISKPYRAYIKWCLRVKPSYSEDVQAINLVVFRHMCTSAQESISSDVKVFFFAFNRVEDPQAELLQYLSSMGCSARPISAARRRGGYGDVTDAFTGRRAAVFSINKVALISKDVAQVDGDINITGVWCDVKGCAYRVERKHGKWTIVDMRITREI